MAYREKKVSQAAFETWRAAQGHYSNYVEGVRNKVRSITKGPLAALTAASDFRLEDLGRKKTALFLILPDEGDLRSLYVPFYAFMFRRLKEAEVPPYPEAEPVYKEPERKRGTTAKKQDVDVSPEEIEEYL